MIKIYDTSRPGYEGSECPTTPARKSKEGQKGVISCFAFNPDYSGLYAAGSYSRTIGLYDERNDGLLYILRGSSSESMGGVIQVQFSPDGHYLFSASRRDNNIRCWDIRNSSDILYDLFRQGDTNQRLTFDIEKSGRFLITGDQFGKILVYDLNNHSENNTSKLILEMTGHDDAVSATIFHPTLPLVASCSGQRKFEFLFEPNGSESDGQKINQDNSFKIWKGMGQYEWNYYDVASDPTQ